MAKSVLLLHLNDKSYCVQFYIGNFTTHINKGDTKKIGVKFPCASDWLGVSARQIFIMLIRLPTENLVGMVSFVRHNSQTKCFEYKNVSSIA